MGVLEDNGGLNRRSEEGLECRQKHIKYGMVKYEMLFDKLICIQLAIKTVGQKHLFNILNRISRYEKSELQLK